jgi:metal-responsive CopG/Arc/MetJ family transcriptional regulator
MDRLQVNFRLDKDLAEKLDHRRVTLLKAMGRIPSRSEVMRLALDLYLKEDQPEQVQN